LIPRAWGRPRDGEKAKTPERKSLGGAFIEKGLKMLRGLLGKKKQDVSRVKELNRSTRGRNIIQEENWFLPKTKKTDQTRTKGEGGKIDGRMN